MGLYIFAFSSSARYTVLYQCQWTNTWIHPWSFRCPFPIAISRTNW